MALDACFLTFLSEELDRNLRGFRVDKIHMPSRDEAVFTFRGGQKKRLLISASTSFPRLSLVSGDGENPSAPPTFCMVLRKHFLGGRLKRVYMPAFERCVMLEFECKNDFYETVEKTIAAELTGRSANLVILEGGKIIDAIRRVDLSSKSGRKILPSARYAPLPAQAGKIPFTGLENTDILFKNPEINLERALMDNISGICPLTAREIAYLATGVSERLCRDLSLSDKSRLDAVIRKIQSDIAERACTPCVIRRAEDGRPVDFSFMPIRQYGGFCDVIPCKTPSDTLESFYGAAAKKNRLEQKTRDLSKLITRLSNRISRTTEVRKKELEAANGADRYRVYGELINANLYRMEKGMTKLVAENYFDGGTAEIRLNPALTPAANAQAYFKKYVKAKNSREILTKLIEQDAKEFDYLESVFMALCDCESAAEAQQIRDELAGGGYIKSRARQKRGEAPAAPRLLEKDGFSILVGKNNLQNDLITVKLSRRDDIWLHAKAIHSAHVLIRCGGRVPPDSVVEYAARVCAYYSKGKNDKKVEVDYCPVQNVKKPAGAKPGMVVYDGYRTVVVQPLEV